jgi:catechol 2,3-dioxygenase-like lactoylglutathione lyase family enzyme
MLALLLAACPLLSAQTQRPAITGIAFVRVYAADPDASAKRYEGDMGFVRTRAEGKDVYSVNSAQWFEVAPLPAGQGTSRLAAVAFTTRNEKGLEAYLRAHGQTILPQSEPGTFGVKDPEGNLILFVQQGLKHPGSSTPAPRATAHRLIHAGFLVRNADVEDHFYKDLLGFRLNWKGGKNETVVDWQSMQVPEGTDWLEYMLNAAPEPTPRSLGVMNHFSLGTTSMDTVIGGLATNQCTDANCQKTQLGRDGKLQLNLFDPDLTRIEYMEFKPLAKSCCSPILGKFPTEIEDK